MSNTTFVDGSTLIASSWLNDVNNVTYTQANVARLGALPNTGADSFSVLQGIINTNQGGTVTFPAGVFKISAPLVVSASGTRLVGAGRNSTIVEPTTANTDAIQFTCSSQATVTTFLNTVGCSGMTIQGVVASTTGAGIRCTQVNGGQFFDVCISNMPEGLKVLGGQLSNYYDMFFFVSGSLFDLAGTANSAMVSFLEAPIAGGLFQHPESTNCWGLKFAGSYDVDTCIFVSACDGLKFEGIYASGGYGSIVKVLALRAGSSVVLELDFYEDGVNNSTGSQYILSIPNSGFASPIYSIKVSGLLGNSVEGGILAADPYLYKLDLIGAKFLNFKTWPVQVTGNAARTVVNCTGCTFDNFSITPGAGALFCNNVLALSVSGGSMVNGASSGAAINTSGTVVNFSVVGLSIYNTANDWANSATITSRAWGGNTSNNNDPTSSLSGFTSNNTSVTDVAVLDWYLEGGTGYTVPATSPTATFGGSGTGITYTTQTLNYTRIGNRVMGELLIVFSAIGTFSSATVLLILGLPVAHWSGSIATPVAVRVTSVTSGVGDTLICGETVPGTSTIRLDKMSSGALAQLSWGDLTTTTSIQCSFNYPVAP